MDQDKIVREHLLWLLDGGDAHMPFEEAIEEFPMDRINEVFPNGAYSAWGLLEHIRRTQADILDFVKNPDYKEREWPKGYWPGEDEKATEADWRKTTEGFRKDLAELKDIVKNPKTNLYEKLAHGTGQTILREILLASDHNAYEIGEFGIMRQVMGTWGENHK